MALTSRQDLPVSVDEMLQTQSLSAACTSDTVLTPCDTASHVKPCDTSSHVAADLLTVDDANESVDVSDVSVMLPVPVATVSTLASAADSNQTVSSLVSYVQLRQRL